MSASKSTCLLAIFDKNYAGGSQSVARGHKDIRLASTVYETENCVGEPDAIIGYSCFHIYSEVPYENCRFGSSIPVSLSLLLVGFPLTGFGVLTADLIRDYQKRNHHSNHQGLHSKHPEASVACLALE